MRPIGTELVRRTLPWMALGALLGSSTALGASLSRPADPVVVAGSVMPAGTVPGDVVAFRWTGAWQQVPVQVDERAVVDLNQPFDNGYSPCTGLCFPLPPSGTVALQYTDASTHTGADPDATVDGNDEIVFMAKDVGDRPALFAEPPDVVAGSGVEIHVTDPLDGGEGWVYLFQQTGALDPSAGQTYVSYDFQLLSGSYLATYQLNGGPNPEDSTVASAFYSRHFSDRWLDDGLEITAGGATGVDVLDRHKLLVVSFGCFRSEDSLDAGEGCFVVNKSGPVRAIRSYMGANSGPHTQRQHLFYERREDLTTFVRVHSLPGVEFFLDYSPAAAGMVYRNDLNPAGVTIDGTADAVTAGPITWETVDGAQGGLTMLTSIATDIPGFGYTSTYLDDASTGGCTGDAFSYGASGVATGSLPSTDVAAGGANSLAITRITYFEAPGEADGPARQQQHANPLAVTATPVGGGGGGGSDVPITGLKLIVVDKLSAAQKAKAVFVAKDPAIVKGTGTDAAQIDATLDVMFRSHAGCAGGTFAMPQGGSWLVNDAAVAKYVNKTAPTGGAVKVGLVKPGALMKVVAKSLGDVPLAAALGQQLAGSVSVVATIVNGAETTRLCTEFQLAGCSYTAIAGGTGHKLVCKSPSVGDSECLGDVDPPVDAYLAQWGSAGAANGQLGGPTGITTDAAGSVYVADTSNHRIQKFDSTGAFLSTFGTFGDGDGQFSWPSDVAIDASGNVYVADRVNNRIQKFDSAGVFLTKWPVIFGPNALAVDTNGDVYAVAEGDARVVKYDGDGTLLDQWGSTGSGDGQFDYPWGVAVDVTGNVFVADRFNRRIQKFDADGNFLAKWGSLGCGDGQLIDPFGVATDASGNVYVVDGDAHRVQLFDGAGAFLAKFGTPGSGNGGLLDPWDVTVGPSGDVYVTDGGNGRIQRFSAPIP